MLHTVTPQDIDNQSSGKKTGATTQRDPNACLEIIETKWGFNFGYDSSNQAAGISKHETVQTKPSM